MNHKKNQRETVSGFSGTPNNGTPDPFYSHTTPIRIPKDMGMVWEAYHKGVPLLGVPGITLDVCVKSFTSCEVSTFQIVPVESMDLHLVDFFLW